MNRLEQLPRDVQYFLLMQERPIYQAQLRAHLKLAGDWGIFLRDYSAQEIESEDITARILDLCALRQKIELHAYFKQPDAIQPWQYAIWAYEAGDWETARWILTIFYSNVGSLYFEMLPAYQGKAYYLDFHLTLLKHQLIKPTQITLQYTPEMLTPYREADCTSLYLTLLSEDRLKELMVLSKSLLVWQLHYVLLKAVALQAWKIAYHLLTNYSLFLTRHDRYQLLKDEPRMNTDLFALIAGSEARWLIKRAAQKKHLPLLVEFFGYEQYLSVGLENLDAVLLLLQEKEYVLLDLLNDYDSGLDDRLMKQAFNERHYPLVAALRNQDYGGSSFQAKWDSEYRYENCAVLCPLYEVGIGRNQIDNHRPLRKKMYEYAKQNQHYHAMALLGGPPPKH